MRQEVERAPEKYNYGDWPRCEREPGKWKMSPARRVIYENPDGEAEAIWRGEQVLGIIERNRLAPKDVCELGVLSAPATETIHRRLNAKIWAHEVPIPELESNNGRADPAIRDFLKEIQFGHPAAFDMLLLMDLMEHVEDYHGFLRVIRPMAKYKVFHMPMDINVQAVLGSGLRKRRDTFMHISYFTRETMMRTLNDLGYEVVDWCYTPWRVTFCRELPGKLMKIPRKVLFALSPDFAVKLLGGYSLLILAK